MNKETYYWTMLSAWIVFGIISISTQSNVALIVSGFTGILYYLIFGHELGGMK